MLRESPPSSQVCGHTQTCVLFALPEERKYFQPGPDQRVSHSGAGARNAAHAASEMLSACMAPPGLLVICGFAGGLSPNLKPGHLLLADRVLDSTSFLLPHSIRTLLHAGNLEALPLVIHQGALVTTDRVLIYPQEKRELARQTGAIAVDMETAAAAQVAEAQGVPWLAIRVITDGVEDAMPLDFNRLTDADGNIDRARVVGATLAHPWKIPALIRLGRRSAQAGRNLARFLETFLQSPPKSLLSSDGSGRIGR